MSGHADTFRVIVIGGGHAGVEAAWAAANLLASASSRPERDRGPQVALVTLNPAKIGVMSCNPAIGGLAKGQLVREIDALGGVMGLAADASGLQFKVLNGSKGAAVRGPRCQSDKHEYADSVRRLVESRADVEVIAGAVERLSVRSGAIRGVSVATADGTRELRGLSVVLTTGTFMRGLMHTGEARVAGGRHGEGAAVGISATLRELGFELGRLKTGTPPRLHRRSIDWSGLPAALGDAEPLPFSDLTDRGRFPELPQIECRQTTTTASMHELIRENLHRAPMYSGTIDATGPRYCPSIEDKVVRFPDRRSHGVFLERESLREDSVYCNGISTSLPAEVQDEVVRGMPGCERAEVLRHGYAVEYDSVLPHQILATGMTRTVAGLFLAGQINGTSGYEEAAAQGVVAGVNAARRAIGEAQWVLGRDEAYIGVLMDDLVTKTPVEPYRMFTSRAEHRLLLRADNAADRLTPTAESLGLLAGDGPGAARRELYRLRHEALSRGRELVEARDATGSTLGHRIRQDAVSVDDLAEVLAREGVDAQTRSGVAATLHAEQRYQGYLRRQRAEVRRHATMERREIPAGLDWGRFDSLRNEARDALSRFRPTTFGQASRLEGITPADLTLLGVLVARARSTADGAGAHSPA